MDILGIIPARGGSKEVPRKNLLKLGDKTLIELAFESTKRSKFLTRTILSTDDDEIMKVGEQCGCEVPFKRPKELAQDNSTTLSVVRHAVDWLKNRQKWSADIIVLLQPTTQLT